MIVFRLKDKAGVGRRWPGGLSHSLPHTPTPQPGQNGQRGLLKLRGSSFQNKFVIEASQREL